MLAWVLGDMVSSGASLRWSEVGELVKDGGRHGEGLVVGWGVSVRWKLEWGLVREKGTPRCITEIWESV